MFSAGSDRILIIIPHGNFDNSTLCFLVEILSLVRNENGLTQNNNNQDNNNQLILTIKGLKRFKPRSNSLTNIIENMVIYNNISKKLQFTLVQEI